VRTTSALTRWLRVRAARCDSVALRAEADPTTPAIKEYGQDPSEERRFSPPVVLSERVKIVSGYPDETKISTSYVERQNLTTPMGMRRFTRTDQRLFEEGREPLSGNRAALPLHDLRPLPQGGSPTRIPGPRRRRRASQITSGPARKIAALLDQSTPGIHSLSGGKLLREDEVVPFQIKAAAILDEWRAVERELQAADPRSTVAEALRAEAARLRDAYKRVVDQQSESGGPDVPPFPEPSSSN